MTWVTKTTDAEPIFHAGSVLPCIANIAVEHGFSVDEERRIVPSVWTFLVGVPAGSKSTAQQRAETLYRQCRTTWLGHQGDDPFIMAEGSIPGIFAAMQERYDAQLGRSPGILVRDEAGRLLAQRDESVADFLCGIIDGGDYRRNLRALQDAARAGGVDRSLLRAGAFSGRMATTFARLREVTDTSHIEGGLFSRFIWCVGPQHLGEPRFRVHMHESEAKRVRDEWLDWRAWLLATFTAEQLDHETGTPPPGCVRVSDEAYDLLEATLWKDFVEHAKVDSPLNSSRKRAVTQAVIVAGLYALTEQSLIVKREHMTAAIALLRLSLSGLAAMMPTLATDAENIAAERVYIALTQSEVDAYGVPKSELYSTRLTKKELNAALEQLLDAGRIARVHVRTGQPGRPSERYITVDGLARWGSPQATSN